MRKMPPGVETSFLERESLCVCSLLPFSLDFPLPSYVGTRVSHASSRGWGRERKRKWMSSKDSDGTHGGALHWHSTSCPTGGHLREIPRQKKKKKIKDWFGTFLKKINFFFLKKKGEWPKNKDEFLPQSRLPYCSACSELCTVHSLWL